MIARPISKSISRGIALAINDPNGAGFDPRSLFASGEQGVWYDPSDMSTLFQDAAGTIPVTAAGQPVGLMRDKSGRGNHATQATATSRPILQTEGGKWYLAFDGVDDGMVTAAINFTATNKMSYWSGVRKLSDAVPGVITELSATTGSNTGSFSISGPALITVGPNYRMEVRGDAATIPAWLCSTFTSPITSVLMCLFDIAGAGRTTEIFPRINGVIPTLTTGGAEPAGGGNFGNYPLYIGRRGGTSLAFNGRIYSLIVRGAASSAQQITDTENYVNSKTGAY